MADLALPKPFTETMVATDTIMTTVVVMEGFITITETGVVEMTTIEAVEMTTIEVVGTTTIIGFTRAAGEGVAEVRMHPRNFLVGKPSNIFSLIYAASLSFDSNSFVHASKIHNLLPQMTIHRKYDAS